jgi:hypothetical protein
MHVIARQIVEEIRHVVRLGVAPSNVDTAIAAHVAAADPHTGYQLESEKGQANGYASLGSGGLIPTAQLATGAADAGTVPTADGAGGVAWASASGGLSQVASSPLMTDGEAYVWPGHGEVTPPTLGDWTAQATRYVTDALGGTGSLASAHGGLLLRSTGSARYFGAYKAITWGTGVIAGFAPAMWVQADLPSIAFAVEGAAATPGTGQHHAIEVAGAAGGTACRVRVTSWITGTFQSVHRDVEVEEVPRFFQIRQADGLWWFEVSWLTADGPWRVLWKVAAAYTPVRVWVMAYPPDELDAVLEARGVDVPWLHYEEG